jgi:UDP-glucuronate 4-epimerase
MNRKIFITGVAGFIGFHTALACLKNGNTIIGIDNLNDYYDVSLKQDRLKILEQFSNFKFAKIDIADESALTDFYKQHSPNIIIHLAAQAGVRYSLDNPRAYINSNIVGFLNMLELARAHKPNHFIYASSSSVYGGNTKLPFAESDPVDTPQSLYAATKKSNELMAYSYAHLYQIPLTGLRFFTVYGAWGRPDMAYFKFAKAMVGGKTIDVYNHGDMKRDFTYIDDIVSGILNLIDRPPTITPPHAVYNIGHHKPEPLMDMIKILEIELGVKANINFMPMQAGDVVATYADIDLLKTLTGFEPKTNLNDGLKEFVKWFKEYYRV